MSRAARHQKFYDSLAPEESMLLTLRDELYAGSWDTMIEDLKDRLKGKPYIFKLVNRIEEDIDRISRLRDYEKKNSVNLREFGQMPVEQGKARKDKEA